MRIPMEDWLRGCVYHDGRHGEVTLSTNKVLEIANYIQLTRTSLADGMIELPPYDRNYEPQTDCNGCKYFGHDELEACGYYRHGDLFEPQQTEPQTEEWYTYQDEQEYNARHGKE